MQRNMCRLSMIEWAMMTADIETRLTVHVQPNANRNMIVDFKEGILRVKINAPPVDGKANRELVDFLSDLLGLRKSNIKIDRGLIGRKKVITIIGLEHGQLMKILSDFLAQKT
jgi:uncharacterized protein (TIGR00251 family)